MFADCDNEVWKSIFLIQQQQKNNLQNYDDFDEVEINFSNSKLPRVNFTENKNTWDLTIELIEKKIKGQQSLRKRFKLTYDLKNYFKINETFKRSFGIKKQHKGCLLGKMLSDFLKGFKKITFKNLIGFDPYDFEQPDFILITLFMNAFKIDFKFIKEKYLSTYWFEACSGLNHNYKIPWQLSERKLILDNFKFNLEFFNNFIIFS